MSEGISKRKTPHQLLLLFWAIVLLTPLMMLASGGAQTPLPDPIDASATPSTPKSIRSRIDIGPLRELDPIFRKERDDDDQLSEFMYLVEDKNRVLSKAQASVLADDAHRLTVHGIPTMFVFRESAQSPEESAVHASRLRMDRKLETAPGADDGMLFLVTEDVETSSGSMFLTISYGAHTLPKGGLTETTLRDVYQKSIRPRMRFGLVSDALKIGIRKIIYLETYYPDPSFPLTSLQNAVRATVNVAAPIVALGGAVSVIVGWRSSKSGRPGRHRALRHRYVKTIVLGGTIVVVLAALSVYSHNRFGIVAVCLGGLAIAAHVHFLSSAADRSRAPVRRVLATSHFTKEQETRADSSRIVPGTRLSDVAQDRRQ